MDVCDKGSEAPSASPKTPHITQAAVVILAGVASAAHAQTSTVNVSVDATAAVAPLTPVWAFHGYDEINYTTTPEGEAVLAALTAAHAAPVYVRSHFLFNTGDGTPAMKWGSTNVYSEDAGGAPLYSWTLTDGILDAIAAAGAFPFVEIGFMPQALSTRPVPLRNSSTFSLDSGCFYPPKDYVKWADLIRAWATHAKERYENAEDRWLWELWNEPDIGYWRGTFEEYAKLFDTTEAALHEVLPKAALGGPAVALPAGRFLTQFLEHCASGTNAVTGATGTRLDHVTFHAKGGVSLTDGQVEMSLGNQLRLHQAGFSAVASVAQFKDKPIYITEADPDGCAACTADMIPASRYRTSTAYGAYEVSMMKHSIDLAEQMGVKLAGVLTWAFTFPGAPYFAGYRELATNGINLPVMAVFQLLGRLTGTRAPLTSTGAHSLDDILADGIRGEPEVDGIAALDRDMLRVLIWNYHDHLVSAPTAYVHVRLRLPAGFGSRVSVSHLRVDEGHGDAYSAWVAQGRPATPSEEQISALKEAMTPSMILPTVTSVVSADGAASVDFALPRFGVSLLTVQPDTQGGDPHPPHKGTGCNCGLGCRDVHDNRTLSLLALTATALLLRRSWRRTKRPRH